MHKKLFLVIKLTKGGVIETKEKINRLEKQFETRRTLLKKHMEGIEKNPENIEPGMVFDMGFDTHDKMTMLGIMPVMKHPDDGEMWFIVPVDDRDGLVGGVDVPFKEHPYGPMCARGNHGMWMTKKEILRGEVICHCTNEEDREVSHILSDMVRGGVGFTEVEHMPEYEEHMFNLVSILEQV